MDLSQKATRVKRDLQAALARPESANVRHAVESFDSFVDGVVSEIMALKKAAQPAEREPAETFEQPAEHEFATDSDLRRLN